MLNIDSLRNKGNELITVHHPDLRISIRKRLFHKVSKYAFDKKRWWLILVSILFVYALSVLININSLNWIHLDLVTSKFIVDQRSANTVTIISMTLAVVGFLLSNIAVKESFAYKLLFKNSKLYPIIYFTLGTIGSLILISSLRDTIKSGFVYSRLVLMGTYLVLVVLFLIGYLFRSIINFTNSNRIQELLQEELINEAKNNLRKSLLKKYTSQIYKKIMSDYGAKEYSLTEAFASSSLEETLPLEDTEPYLEHAPKPPRYLYDINVYKLGHFLDAKKSKGRLYYSKLNIDEFTSETDNYIWLQNSANSEKEKKSLIKCLRFRKKKILDQNSNEVRSYFDQKLEEYAEANKYKNLDELLKAYLKLYELEIRNSIL